jgi:hypothetical protein
MWDCSSMLSLPYRPIVNSAKFLFCDTAVPLEIVTLGKSFTDANMICFSQTKRTGPAGHFICWFMYSHVASISRPNNIHVACRSIFDLVDNAFSSSKVQQRRLSSRPCWLPEVSVMIEISYDNKGYTGTGTAEIPFRRLCTRLLVSDSSLAN